MGERKFEYKLVHIETLEQMGHEIADSLEALDALMLMGNSYMLIGYYNGMPYKLWHRGVHKYERDYNEKL